MKKQLGLLNNNTEIYQSKKGALELKADFRNETIWLTQQQVAVLFDVQKAAISKHVKHIFDSGELNFKSTVSKRETLQKEGRRTVARLIEFYNLDLVLSIGYRVNSIQATLFRKWATRILKKHLIDGYTINEKRLKTTENKYFELQRSVGLLGNLIKQDNISDDTKSLISVIVNYSRALDLLDDYDYQRLIVPSGKIIEKSKLSYNKAKKIIDTMKEKFKASSLFGQEKDDSFKSSIGAIYQTFNRKDVYPTIEEKAAHLLYFVTKNHSFVDGNKRIAAAIFICYLESNGILYLKNGSKIIDNNTLAALTIMIASSSPNEKETIIKVILNILSNRTM